MRPSGNPELDLHLPDTKTTWMDNALVIVSNPFAKSTKNDELMAMARKAGLPEKETTEAKRLIATTGFEDHHWHHLPNRPHNPPEEIIARETTIGTLLLRQVMEAFGWDKIDSFIDTSAFLPSSINRQILEKSGIDPKTVTSRSYRLACAGLVTAFIDALADPRLKGKRLVIGTLEPLSELIGHDHLVNNIAIPATFEDGHSFVGIDTSRFELMARRVSAQSDRGVIQIPTMYDYQNQEHNKDRIPPYYEINKSDGDLLRVSDQGVFLNIKEPRDGSTVYMNGARTGVFFGKETARVIDELLTSSGNRDLLRQLGRVNTFIHPASQRVGDEIAARLNERGLIDNKTLPFYLAKAERANSSSNTVVEHLRYMLENDLVDLNLPQLWVAPGIGSAIAAAIINLK